MSDWFRVFVTGNRDNFIRFFNEHYSSSLLAEDPAENRANRQGRVYEDARSFAIREIEKSDPHEIAVLAQSTLTGLWFRLTLKTEPELPYRVTAYVSQRIQPPAGSQRALNQQELVKEIGDFVDRMTAADAFSGVILVAKDDKIIYKTARGLASKAYHAPIRIDTKFNLASVGKNFTAIAILQLVEEGKLSLTDTVGKHLPDYPNKEVAQKVTIHHLLSHSSGLGELYGEKWVCKKGSLREVRDYFPLFADDPKPLAFEPSARWQYSNVGYVILGAILERVTGENFFEYIRKRIFRPVGMINTDYYEADRDTPNLAMGYTNFLDLGEGNYDFRLGERRNAILMNGVRGNPQGGVYSTTEDLLRYTLALKSNQLVSKATLDLMTTKQVFARKYDAGDTYWGYGFELEEISGKHVLGHGGGDFGISSGFRMYPDSGGYTIVVLSNYDRGGIVATMKLQELIVQNSILAKE